MAPELEVQISSASQFKAGLMMAQNQQLDHSAAAGKLNERTHLISKNHVPLYCSDNQNQTVDRSETIHETAFHDQTGNLTSTESLQPSPSLAKRLRRQRFRNFYQTSLRRFPKGKAVFLVLFITVLESFGLFATIGGLQEMFFGDDPGAIWVFTLLSGSAGKVIYPIAGVIADVYLGRYKVIHVGLWFLWIGFGILAFSQSLVGLTYYYRLVHFVLPILSAILISVGSGSVEVNVISFGVDQLAQGATSDELSSYFYWYYFARTCGFFISVVGFSNKDSRIYVVPSAMSVIAVVAITIALILHYCLQHWYYKGRQQENPLRSIINVFYYSATVKRGLPVYRRAFRYGEERKPRIELAKEEFDGIFPSEEVENVKTFYRILFLLVTLAGFSFTFGATYSMLAYEIEDASSKLKYVSVEIPNLIDAMTFIILLPLLNYILIPLFYRYNMRVRIGSGLVCTLLSCTISVCLRALSVHKTAAYQSWLVLPAVLINAGQLLTVVTSVEFIYAQSPESMKGLLTGLLYLEYGVFNGLAAVLFSVYLKHNQSDIMYYYIALTILAVLGFVGYVIVAHRYRNRQRPTSDRSDEELERRRLAEKRFEK